MSQDSVLTCASQSHVEIWMRNTTSMPEDGFSGGGVGAHAQNVGEWRPGEW